MQQQLYGFQQLHLFSYLIMDSHQLAFVLRKDWAQEGISNIAHWPVVGVLNETLTGSINSAHNILKYLDIPEMLLIC